MKSDELTKDGKISKAEEYANDITSKYLDSSILLTKEEFNSYLYWAYYNGMNYQKKVDVNKILFS